MNLKEKFRQENFRCLCVGNKPWNTKQTTQPTSIILAENSNKPTRHTAKLNCKAKQHRDSGDRKQTGVRVIALMLICTYKNVHTSLISVRPMFIFDTPNITE